jgi:hypothetical protein
MRSGGGKDEKKSMSLPGIEAGGPAPSLFTILTELSLANYYIKSLCLTKHHAIKMY